MEMYSQDTNSSFDDEACEAIAMKIRPRAHLFGHIHDDASVVKSGDIVFSNGAVLTGVYEMNLRPYSLIDL